MKEFDKLYEIDESYYYVYEHWLDDEIIYVGKGVKGRAFSLVRNLHWNKKVKGRESEVEVVIKGYFKNEQDAFDYEEMVIIELIQNGVDLTNVTHNKNKSPNYNSRYKLSLQRKINKHLKRPIEYFPDIELKDRNPSRIIEVKRISQVFNLICKNKGKIVIFSNQKANVLRMLKSKKFNVLNASFKNNEMANLSIQELIGYEELLNTGSIPDPYDIVILSPYGMGNVKITDNKVQMVIIDTTNKNECEHSLNSINVELSTLICKSDSDMISKNVYYFEFPTELLNVELDTEAKRNLSESLGILDCNNRRGKWPTIKKSLNHQGFLVEDKIIKVNGKSTRVSIVNYKE